MNKVVRAQRDIDYLLDEPLDRLIQRWHDFHVHLILFEIL